MKRNGTTAWVLLAVALASGCAPAADNIPVLDAAGTETVDADGDGVGANADCNDIDPDLWQQLAGFPDADGDGFGVDSTPEDLADDEICSGADLPLGYVDNTTDCDDNESAVYPGAYETPYDGIDNDCDDTTPDDDQDGDGHGVADDCDDQDGDVFQILSLYQDADLDGVSAPMAAMDVCAGPKTPTGWRTKSGDDCDDHNAAHFQELPGYTDVDEDGVSVTTVASVLCTGTELPHHYAAEAPVAVDCDDTNRSVHPGAHEIVYDDIDNDCDESTPDDDLDEDTYGHDDDCDDNNPDIYQIVALYPDADLDEVSAGVPAVQECIGVGTPEGWTLSAGQDCNDHNNQIWQLLVGFPDVDFDGFGVDATGEDDTDDLVCSGDELPYGFSESATDCAETDANLHTTYMDVYDDADSDGYADSASPVEVCGDDDITDDGYLPLDEAPELLDCDPSDGAVNPGAPDVHYDMVDKDCSATPDGDPVEFDADGDGYSVEGAPEGFDGLLGTDDCVDFLPEIHPGATDDPSSGVDEDCVDADECAGEGDGNDCDINAACTDLIDSFVCECNSGFLGDGTSCVDANECLGEGDGNDCHDNATCDNLDDGQGFTCSCEEPLLGDGLTCACEPALEEFDPHNELDDVDGSFTPIVHQPSFRGERELFGYAPNYQPNVPSFDPLARVLIRDGLTVQRLDPDTDVWEDMDFADDILAAYPDWDGSPGGSLNGYLDFQRIVFDDDGDAYTVVNAEYWAGVGANLVLFSTDMGETWSTHELPHGYFHQRLEYTNGSSTLSHPPLVMMTKGSWVMNDTELIIVPMSKDEYGNLVVEAHVLLDDNALNQGGGFGSNFAASDGDDTYVVWASDDVGTTGTPAYVAHFDHLTGIADEPMYLGNSGTGAADGHNIPAIGMDSTGVLHVVLGAHHKSFKYTYSMSPGDWEDWSEPKILGGVGNSDPVDPSCWKNCNQYSYVSMQLDLSDNIHIVARWSGNTYHFTQAYLRKPAGQDWEPRRNLVVPFRRFYTHWYQKLSLGPNGNLFLSYAEFTDQLFQEHVDEYERRWPEEPLTPRSEGCVPTFFKDPDTCTSVPSSTYCGYHGQTTHNPVVLFSTNGGDSFRPMISDDF
jgi:hypothetical protein